MKTAKPSKAFRGIELLTFVHQSGKRSAAVTAMLMDDFSYTTYDGDAADE